MTICPPAFSRPRVHGWLADQQGCGYYRIRLPLDALAETGVAVTYSERLDTRTLAPGAVVVGQRCCNPGPTAIWEKMQGQVRRVYELDDDLLGVDPKSPQASEFFARPGVRKNLLANIRTADAVTVSTPYLAGRVVDGYGVDPDRVHVVPNCIHPDLLKMPPPATDRLTVGWGGSATHRGDFEVVARHLRRFFSRHPEIRMRYMGVQHNDLVRAPVAELAPWIPIFAEPEKYYANLQFDIGIAPLSEHPFNRHKSYIKALEYAARGIPVIASDLPAYRDFVKHGETGFLVRRDHEWEIFLHELATDDGLRERMGRAAREQAAQWTIGKHLDAWRRAYWPGL